MRAPSGPPGRIIFLNGASSSGKSSIAEQLLEVLEQPWFHLPVDAINAMRAKRRTMELSQAELDVVLARTRAGPRDARLTRRHALVPRPGELLRAALARGVPHPESEAVLRLDGLRQRQRDTAHVSLIRHKPMILHDAARTETPGPGKNRSNHTSPSSTR
jgi:hypothetical protein